MKRPQREGRSWLIGWLSPERVGNILIGLANIVHTAPDLKNLAGSAFPLHHFRKCMPAFEYKAVLRKVIGTQ